MDKRVFAALLAACALALAPAAHAGTLPINAIQGDWTNAVPSVTIDNTGATHTARWGTPAGTPYGQSGYDWTSMSTPFNQAVGVAFSLGTFAHQNYPITGSTLSTIDLDFSLQIDGLPALTGVFHFRHDETPNAPPCTYSPVVPSTNYCPDAVFVTSPVINVPFTYDSTTYYFTLLGFSSGLPVSPVTQFVTQEGQLNTADLYGVITEQQVPTVPEPATLLLLGTGVASLASRLRRRR